MYLMYVYECGDISVTNSQLHIYNIANCNSGNKLVGDIDFFSWAMKCF